MIDAGSAAGGRFADIGNLFFLPAVKNGKPGLYALNETLSRFEALRRIPASNKEDYLLVIEIISHREYAFVIRHEGADSRFADLGWSIAQHSPKLKRPQREDRLVLLLSGQDSTAADAIQTEIRRSIPHLHDRFREMSKKNDLYPLVRRVASEFDPAFEVLRQCKKLAPGDDAGLQILFAVEHVEMLRALDRFDRIIRRQDDEAAWRRSLEAAILDRY